LRVGGQHVWRGDGEGSAGEGEAYLCLVQQLDGDPDGARHGGCGGRCVEWWGGCVEEDLWWRGIGWMVLVVVLVLVQR